MVAWIWISARRVEAGATAAAVAATTAAAPAAVAEVTRTTVAADQVQLPREAPGGHEEEEDGGEAGAAGTYTRSRHEDAKLTYM